MSGSPLFWLNPHFPFRLVFPFPFPFHRLDPFFCPSGLADSCPRDLPSLRFLLKILSLSKRSLFFLFFFVYDLEVQSVHLLVFSDRGEKGFDLLQPTVESFPILPAPEFDPGMFVEKFPENIEILVPVFRKQRGELRPPGEKIFSEVDHPVRGSEFDSLVLGHSVDLVLRQHDPGPVPVAGQLDIKGGKPHARDQVRGKVDGFSLALVDRDRVSVVDLRIVPRIEPDLRSLVHLDGEKALFRVIRHVDLRHGSGLPVYDPHLLVVLLEVEPVSGLEFPLAFGIPVPVPDGRLDPGPGQKVSARLPHPGVQFSNVGPLVRGQQG